MTAETDLRAINRVASVGGLILVALGAVGAVTVVILVWQLESHLNKQGSIYGTGPGAGSAPSFLDRIAAATQYGGTLAALALLVIAAGVALHLAAAHLPEVRHLVQHTPPPRPPIIHVDLEAE